MEGCDIGDRQFCCDDGGSPNWPSTELEELKVIARGEEGSGVDREAAAASAVGGTETMEAIMGASAATMG